MPAIRRACVIGAGAAGLATIRHLAACPNEFEIEAFEQNSQVGGLWNYSEDVDTVDKHVHGSLYFGVNTILPKEVMAYPDYAYPDDVKASFVPAATVLEYFQSYAKYFHLNKYITFNTRIEAVSQIRGSEPCQFSVTTCNISTGERQTKLFDVVFVANGHYSLPDVPHFPSQSMFKGNLMHSHSYRRADKYTGKNVAILGAEMSGIDIALQVSNFAKTVYLCHRKPPLQSDLPSNVMQKEGIVDVSGSNSVCLTNGEQLKDLDDIIFCTGYRYSFPFLSSELMPANENGRLTPLFRHMIHTNYPANLFFIGLPKLVCPCLLFDYQAKLAVKVLRGETVLPTREDMLLDQDNDFSGRLANGIPARHAHRMGCKQWEYLDGLAALGQFTSVPFTIREIFNNMITRRYNELLTYRSNRYEIKADNTWSWKYTPGDYDYRHIQQLLGA